MNFSPFQRLSHARTVCIRRIALEKTTFFGLLVTTHFKKNVNCTFLSSLLRISRQKLHNLGTKNAQTQHNFLLDASCVKYTIFLFSIKFIRYCFIHLTTHNENMNISLYPVNKSPPYRFIFTQHKFFELSISQIKVLGYVKSFKYKILSNKSKFH